MKRRERNRGKEEKKTKGKKLKAREKEKENKRRNKPSKIDLAGENKWKVSQSVRITNLDTTGESLVNLQISV